MERDQKSVELPAPTAWPIVLAFGVTLLFAGLLTSADLTVVGAVLALVASVGWFRDVLPHERHEMSPVDVEQTPIVSARTEVTRPSVEPHRLRIPVEIYPVTAGMKGGLAGSVAMAVLACAYGLLSHGSIWYPINLLAAVVKARALQLPMSYLTSFHLTLFLVASLLHVVTSILVGLLYGVMLPMFPRRPILLGGLIAPIMWSGLLYATLGMINPLLDRQIDWKWFVASQIGFGIVAGLVVVRQARVRTRQFQPFAVRAGIEAPGWMEDKNRENGRP
ncbi:MAG TPA: hypothetical protein VK752_29865 [Bryobacteraceae bacterium]|jgi:hypothetical protein|nr:hypothetical protein [Bryobacteraceae bacterium]